MDRITRDEMLISVAHIVADRGTCSRLQVGCVVSRDGRIITTGYNGAPSGMPHCDHSSDSLPKIMVPADPPQVEFRELPGRFMTIPEPALVISDAGCQIAEHAERNAIAFAARYGLALEGSEIHCTHAPCLACARTIINAGIRKVSYETAYRLTEGVELLETAGLIVVYMGKGE